MAASRVTRARGARHLGAKASSGTPCGARGGKTKRQVGSVRDADVGVCDSEEDRLR